MLKPSHIKKTVIKDSFWSPKIKTVKNQGIPYFLKAFSNQIEGVPKSYCIHNFEVAAGKKTGNFGGCVFQDSDLYKFIEAVGYYLAVESDSEVRQSIDGIIDLIEQAQLKDGYVNTYFIINGIEKRWQNLAAEHELYCAGHLMEAACAYYEGTGNKKLLEVACRFADCIADTFGAAENQIHGYAGHQEIEIGLLKLFEITGEKNYLEVANYFLETRGQNPNYFEQESIKLWESGETGRTDWPKIGENYSYMQAHIPLLAQEKAVGHAVRANYMYTAAAHLAGITGNSILLHHLEKIWSNIVTRRMYITGGVGSMVYGEAYTFDYDLPNDIMYNETCASIALAMFSQRMLNITGESKYADIMELALYNGILSGMELDGTKFFYVNPISVWRERCEKRADMEPIKPERQGWFNCACCPPNILRTITGLAQYLYGYDDESVYVHLFAASETEMIIKNIPVQFVQTGNYPWQGDVLLAVHPGQEVEFDLALRIPGWCRTYNLTINGINAGEEAVINNGYVHIKRCYSEGDVIGLNLDIEPEILQCSSKVPFNAGKAALRRGAIIYCMEETDNSNDLWNYVLDIQSPVTSRMEEELLGGIVSLQTEGYKRIAVENEKLYDTASLKKEKCILNFIPYYAWCNRMAGNMQVWTDIH